MKYVKYLLALIGVVGAIVALTAGILDAGGQGIFVLVLTLVPAILVGLSEGIKKPFGRAFAGVSFLSFALAAMKTTEAPFENVMMAAAAGVILSVILLVLPEKSKEKK